MSETAEHIIQTDPNYPEQLKEVAPREWILAAGAE